MKIINNICPYGYYMHTIQYNYIAINNTPYSLLTI